MGCQEEMTADSNTAAKLVEYNRWNRDVAVLCNHQRAKPKTFDAQMEKSKAKLDELKEKLKEAKKIRKEAKKDKALLPKHQRNIDTYLNKIAVQEHAMQTKEDTATVSLGTSKLNYLDPRITVAWTKPEDVPINKIFAKTLVEKFEWATDVEGEWRF